MLYTMHGEPGTAATNWLIELTKGPCFGRTLAAFDLAGKRPLWSHTEETPIDFRNLAVVDGKVLFCSEEPRIAAIDGRTGKLLWENRDAAWTNRHAKTAPSIQLSRLAGIVASPDAFYLRSGAFRLFFSTRTGNLLRQERAGSQVLGFFLDGRVYEGGQALDPITGAVLARGINEGRWCGTRTVGGGFILGQYDGRSWNFASHRGLNDDSNVKAPCNLGNWVADGVEISSPAACSCGPHLRGAICVAPGGRWIEDFSKRPMHPRETGPAIWRKQFHWRSPQATGRLTVPTIPATPSSP